MMVMLITFKLIGTIFVTALLLIMANVIAD